jgi:hypothetical protein
MPGSVRQGEAAAKPGPQIAEGIRRIEALGCVVKDLDRGWWTFPLVTEDQTVFLCWRLSETSIGTAGLKEVASKTVRQDYRVRNPRSC